MVNYISVADNENEDNIVDLPLEKDDTLFVSTLAAQYPGASGLKYNVNGRTRAVRCVDGRMYAPEEGWGNLVYYSVYGKSAGKRKSDDESSDAKKFKNTEDSPAFASDLVVLGLPWKTTDAELRDYFEQFGELELAKVKTDQHSGRSKGYGFIRFSDPEVQVRVMLKRHKFDDRYCDIRIPNSNKPYSSSKANVRKIFIGQCSEEITEDDFRDYFGKYGEITDAFIPKPHRAFGFVTFKEADVVPQLTNREHTIKGCKVFVTEAIPKAEVEDRFSGGGGRGRGKDFGGYGKSSGRYDSSAGGSYGRSANRYGGSRFDDSWGGGRYGENGAGGYGGGAPSWKSSGGGGGKDANVDPGFIATVVNQAVAGVLSNIKGSSGDLGALGGGYSVPDSRGYGSDARGGTGGGGNYGQDSRNGSGGDRRWNMWE